MFGVLDLPEQTIDISNGAIEYTRLAIFTELSGLNISADTLQLCLGPEFDIALPWKSPDISLTDTIFVKEWRKIGGRNPYQLADNEPLYRRGGQLLIGGSYTPALGSYWLWGLLGDLTEAIPRRFFKVIVT